MQPNEFLHRILNFVDRPNQYIGGEWNSVQKDAKNITAKLCLSFPDTYAIGMSCHGLKLLYEIVNQSEDLLCERSFIPLPDFSTYLKKYQMPLFTLESKTPIREFHIWGFSVGSESNWTNILQMLHLADISILATERRESDPLILAGGHAVYNPEPAALFLDLAFLGDGEEAILQILRIDAELRKQNMPRKERIITLCQQIPGLYAPNFYDVIYKEDGTIAEINPQAGLPAVIQAKFLPNLETSRMTHPIIGYNDTVHNRIFLEIMRGCTRGCRYCQAGMICRPLRVRSVDSLIQEALELFQNTGYEEISLYSLASSDYPHLEELSRRLLQIFAPKGVGISLPSLRINEQMKILPELIASVRKRTLTLAPEVGTERMRQIVNKPMDEKEMFDILERAYDEGWDTVKLYFMIGLPMQDENDYAGIADLIQKISNARRVKHGKPGFVNASIANFVPKPQTPFQWAQMATREQLYSAQRFIKNLLRSPKTEVKFHDITLSHLEGILARGNRKVAKAMLSAWQNGAYLDAWDDHFNQNAWDDAFKVNNIDTQFFLHREVPTNEILPWSHLHAGVSPQFLLSEWEKSKSQTYTGHCLTEHCNNCGIPVQNCYKKKNN